MAESFALGANNLEGSSPSLGTMESLPMVRQVVLKTTIRLKGRGFDTSILRLWDRFFGEDGSVKPQIGSSMLSYPTMDG